MGLEKYLKVGDKLRIVERDMLSHKENEYKSQLLDIKGDILYIAVPIVEGALVPIHTGGVVKILFFKKEGVFYFYANVLERSKDVKIPYLVVQKISDLEKLQRRNFYRLEVSLPVKFKQLDNSEESEGIVKDISGGGLKLHTLSQLQMDQSIEICLCLECYNINIIGKVVRIEKIDSKFYEYGIYFVEINEKDRDKIIRFIFNMEKKYKKKGVI